MATGKLNSDLSLELGHCWSRAQLDEFVEAHGQGDEFTVAEILRWEDWIDYDGAIFAVCHTRITEAEVLRKFAAYLAREATKIIVASGRDAGVFTAAVEYMESTDEPESVELEEHGAAVQAYITSQMMIEGMGDIQSPEKIEAFKRTLNACKTVRAACKVDAGQAAYSAANWAYRAAERTRRDELGSKYREVLAQMWENR